MPNFRDRIQLPTIEALDLTSQAQSYQDRLIGTFPVCRVHDEIIYSVDWDTEFNAAVDMETKAYDYEALREAYYGLKSKKKEEKMILEIEYPYGLTKILRDDKTSPERHLFVEFVASLDCKVIFDQYTINIYAMRDCEQDMEWVRAQIEDKFAFIRKLHTLKLEPITRANSYQYFNRQTHVYETRLSDDLLAKMNLPTFKAGKKLDNSQVIPFTDRQQLKSLGVIPLFDAKDYDCVCQLSGRITTTRMCNFYGSNIRINPNLVRQVGFELVWVKDLLTYVYKYDPRFELGRARVGYDGGDDNDTGDEERLLTYQVSFLTSKGYTYCNGSEDWCNNAAPIMHRPQEFMYSENYRNMHCHTIIDTTTDEDGGTIVGYIDVNSPLYSRAIIAPDGTLSYETNDRRNGNEPGVPFQCGPEKFYGFYSEDKFGRLLVTRQPIPTTRYYGCEVELEAKSKTNANVMLTTIIPELLKLGFVSGTDGSLNRGVEFRSCPQTFNVLKENLKKFFEVVKPYFRAESSCGVHIHVSRSALSDMDIVKMHNLVYDPNNHDFIEDVANRRSGEYQEFKSGPALIKDARTGKIKFKRSRGYREDLGCYVRQGERKSVEAGKRSVRKITVSKENKYTALNTNHTQTVEFRLFAGTHDYTQMMVYLEFVDALINFVKQSSLTVASRKDFEQWVRDNAGLTYANLCTFLDPKIKKLVGKLPTFNIDKYMTRRNKKKEAA